MTATTYRICKVCSDTIRFNDYEDVCSEMCELHAQGFARLELRRDPSGWRHYLHGAPVSCGTALELAPVTVPSQESLEKEGYRPYQASELRARWSKERDGKILRGRYECPLTQQQEPRALFCVDVLGHEAVITDHGYQRVRWPAKR